MEQRPDGRADASAQADKEADVWSSKVRPAESESVVRRVDLPEYRNHRARTIQPSSKVRETQLMLPVTPRNDVGSRVSGKFPSRGINNLRALFAHKVKNNSLIR